MWPLASAVLIAVFLVATRLGGVASIGSLAMAAGLPVGVAATGRPGVEVAAAVALAALVIVRHSANIGRLLRGEERTIRRPQPTPPSLE